MFIISAILVTCVGIVSGFVVGTVFGFSLASRQEVMPGFRPSNANRLIQWLARPIREFSSGESILFFLLILVWLAIFFLLCAIPVFLAMKLDGDGSPLIAFSLAVFLIAGYVGRHIGKRLWLRVL